MYVEYSITINARPYNFIQMSVCVRRRFASGRGAQNAKGDTDAHSDTLVARTHTYI